MGDPNDSLGDRMKEYEAVSADTLMRRTPVVVRVDGRAFHSLTKRVKMEKPYDIRMMRVMADVADRMAREMSNTVLAYAQSDEISFVMVDDRELTTEPWFGNKLQKIVSVSAAMATLYFNNRIQSEFGLDGSAMATFDSRAFNLPREEVANYVLWRQRDATRNSVQGWGQHLLGHKECQGLSGPELQERMFQEKGFNWNDAPTWQKRGVAVTRRPFDLSMDHRVDWEMPIVSQDRAYVDKCVSHARVEVHVTMSGDERVLKVVR